MAADLLLELVSLCALGDAASVVDPCSELVTDFDSVWGAGTSPGIVDGPPGEALPSAPPQGPESEDFDVESLLDLLLEGTGGGL